MIDIISILNYNINSQAFKKFEENLSTKEILNNEDDYNTYIFFKNDGISIVTDKMLNVLAIHLYSQGKDNFKQYKYQIPNGINFNLSRKEVYNTLGNPSKTGGNIISPILGYIPAWDSYYFKDHTLHILYKKDTNLIDMITIMNPESTPGRNYNQII